MGKVLKEHIPEPIRMACITVTGHDGARWNRFEQNAFDKILVDAPCSIDRCVGHTQWRVRVCVGTHE